MNILILGAGGIGGYYGARLILGGHKVLFVARGAHLQAMQQNGLRVVHESQNLFHDSVSAVGLDELKREYQAQDFDATLLTLKANGTQELLDSLGPWLSAGSGPVISLQNGVENEAILANYLQAHRVVGGLAVRIGGHITKPGVIEAQGPAQIIMGHWPREESRVNVKLPQLEPLACALNEVGIPTRISPDIRYELWRKLVINNGVNPLSALTNLDTHTLSHHPEFGPIVYELMNETAIAANSAGVPLNGKDVDEMFELIRSFNPIKTSMLVDKEMGRPLELEAIAGVVFNQCRKVGKPAPYTQMVLALLRQQMK